jgi:RNA polymerase sigma factor (sigma-70 family)
VKRRNQIIDFADLVMAVQEQVGCIRHIQYHDQSEAIQRVCMNVLETARGFNGLVEAGAMATFTPEFASRLSASYIRASLRRAAADAALRAKRTQSSSDRIDDIPMNEEHQDDTRYIRRSAGRILKSLTKTDRELLVRVYLRGESLSDLASLYKTSTSAMHNRISRARQKALAEASALGITLQDFS